MFTNSLPVTTTSTFPSSDGKFSVVVTTTTSTTTEVEITSPDLTTILSNDGKTIIDTQGVKWTVVKGVILQNGTALPGTNNVVKLVFIKGLIWQQNSGGGWWHWDAINDIWAAGPAPI